MHHSEKNILTKEKLKDKSPRRQVYVEAHHEEVQDFVLRGQGSFEWNTDLIETKKLENNTCQVVQDLYSGEAQIRTSRSSRRLFLNATRSTG